MNRLREHFVLANEAAAAATPAPAFVGLLAIDAHQFVDGRIVARHARLSQIRRHARQARQAKRDECQDQRIKRYDASQGQSLPSGVDRAYLKRVFFYGD